MLSSHKLFNRIRENLDLVLKEQAPLGDLLWKRLIKLHPADIAQLLSYLEDEDKARLFNKLDKSLRLEVFEELSDSLKSLCLSFMSETDRGHLLEKLSITELTDFLDELSDEELSKYLKFLHKRRREKVLSLLKFDPQSAGGIMETDVFTLEENFTVKKSVQILQKLRPDRDLYHEIFITDSDHRLVGSIKLEDLVLKKPDVVLKSIMRPDPISFLVDEDQEEVVKKMSHYSLTIAPIVGDNGIFLGLISSNILVEILQEESSEDIYRMSAVVPIKGTYFQTPFFKLFFQRGSVLFLLVLVQTFSTVLLKAYEKVLVGFGLIYFLSMLISTGGNASSQTSALVIQGMAAGEINDSTRWKFFRRELAMSLLLGLFLGLGAGFRIYLTEGVFGLRTFCVGFSLAAIVVISMILGSGMPLILRRLNLDPAHSAGPLLTTLMDIIGLFIYCLISKWVLVGFG